MAAQSQLLTVSHISETFVPDKILQHYHDLRKKYRFEENWKSRTEKHMWNELCFCILSANVLYDLAKSVIDVMNDKGLLEPSWINNTKSSIRILRKEFEMQNFEPRKKNGELRKYRYPQRRSEQIVKAANILYSKGHSIKNILSQFETDLEARNFFANHIPGLGIKESSHFLRNIGYSNSLAIIDVHMLAFMQKYSLAEFENQYTLTTKTYQQLETILRNFTNFHGLNLAVFDLAVWHYMRSNS